MYVNNMAAHPKLTVSPSQADARGGVPNALRAQRGKDAIPMTHVDSWLLQLF